MVWTVDSPLMFREIVDLDRSIPMAAIFVSWCERKWGEYKKPQYIWGRFFFPSLGNL